MKNRRIAFVQPLIPDGNYLPNLGIMYLAALLLREGFIVRVFDENVDPDANESLAEWQPHLAGFTCVTAALGSACRMAGNLKKKVPGAVVMVGGPHLSAVPRETLEQNPVIDFGITGEAEKSLLQFCRGHLLEGKNSPDFFASIPGLVWRKSGRQVVSNRASQFLEDAELDQLPFPASGSWSILGGNPKAEG